MEGAVVHFRQGRHHINVHQMVVKVADTTKDAQKLIGKHTIWTSPTGKEIKGLIAGLHGRKGNVRVHFQEKGLPGQALGQKVKIN